MSRVGLNFFLLPITSIQYRPQTMPLTQILILIEENQPILYCTFSSRSQVRLSIVTMSVIQDKDFMQIFWDLAVDDADVRLQAVKKFENAALDESYKSYSLKRLVKGLSSPRDSARLGFATALTVFLETHKPDVEEVLSLIDEHTRVSF